MPALFITPDLAYRLERAEAQHLKLQVETCALLQPEMGAHTVAIGGGVAAFTATAYGRKLNHVTGFGLGSSIPETDLLALEAAYARLGLATEIDICPYIHADALQLLAARGYVVNAFSNTYVKVLGDSLNGSPPDSGVQVETVTAANSEDFVAACIAGFSLQTHTRPRALLDILARVAIARDDTRLYIARVDGEIAGSAGLALIDSADTAVAHLYIASTLPAYRGRGIQQALLQARLADAQNAGFKLASITARPSNTSARNALRAGFDLAYSKSTFARRGISSPGEC
ncbi:GNAT family N-acetyltransferase [Undibacterium terreum]|uniref:GNAT family acetyltransferase n=1 Tax=Undibacterium terreum TaxID=1224302 RepID=A0A916XFZ3_9BURK|nr:GNAT family N-acetyltransferase [Undibacterium terreum]GGC67778.1 GNAT family acetyltransferase [Undibacterium terreum]